MALLEGLTALSTGRHGSFEDKELFLLLEPAQLNKKTISMCFHIKMCVFLDTAYIHYCSPPPHFEGGWVMMTIAIVEPSSGF